MTPPFKIHASDVIPIGTILLVPLVEMVRVVDPEGNVLGERYEFNPKAGAVIKNVGDGDDQT